MSILAIIKRIFPDMSSYVMEDLKKIRQPRYMVAGDIDYWVKLRGQINAATGKINSYRDIRKICGWEGKTIPSLGTLRNYLGEGGITRRATAVAEWRDWFERFGAVTQWYDDEIKGLTTPKEWETFRGEYGLFMGY